MKKRAWVLAALVLLAVILSGCGGGSAAKTAPSPTPEPTPRPDRNGFDRDTNQIVTIGELSFGLPAYFEETETGTETKKSFETTDVLSDAGLVCRVSDGLITDQRFEEKKEEIMDKSYPKLKRGSEVSIVSVAGMKGLSSCFTGRTDDDAIDVWCVIVNDPEGCLYEFILYAASDAPYDYVEDFNRILGSARKTAKKPEPTPEPKSETASGAVDPDLKAMLDEYEAFMDEYVKFMKSYNAGSANMNDMMKYLDFLSKYSDFMAKVDAVDEKKLSDADYLYYSQVMLRVSQKLLEAAGK